MAAGVEATSADMCPPHSQPTLSYPACHSSHSQDLKELIPNREVSLSFHSPHSQYIKRPLFLFASVCLCVCLCLCVCVCVTRTFPSAEQVRRV